MERAFPFGLSFRIVCHISLSVFGSRFRHAIAHSKSLDGNIRVCVAILDVASWNRRAPIHVSDWEYRYWLWKFGSTTQDGPRAEQTSPHLPLPTSPHLASSYVGQVSYVGQGTQRTQRKILAARRHVALELTVKIQLYYPGVSAETVRSIPNCLVLIGPRSRLRLSVAQKT